MFSAHGAIDAGVPETAVTMDFGEVPSQDA